MRDIDYCRGECPLAKTCWRFIEYVKRVEDNLPVFYSMTPAYKNGKCDNYKQREYYGQ